MHVRRRPSVLMLVSKGPFPREAERMGRVIKADFTFMFAAFVAGSVGLRLLVFFVHGE